EAKLAPYCVQHALLMQIPGVDWVVAAVLIAEIGVDMSVFLSVYHLAAWAGVCPGNHESAGKQKSGRRARKGNVHLRTMLVGAAMSAARTKGSYLKDKYHRLKARRGALRAALRSQDPRLRLSHARQKPALSRSRRSLSRPDQPDPNRRQPQTTSRAPRLQGHPRTKGRARMTHIHAEAIFVAVTRFFGSTTPT